ncbi:MAG: hypothetical protein HWE25_06565 [Alphaproteobacteria bacterium]|nr:hypothetical protein [Alphaproteobacteria bacterium]
MRILIAATIMTMLNLGASSGVRAHHPEVAKPHIYATGWGITLASDGSGFYNDFARFTLGPDSTENTYIVSPYKRAMRQFRNDKRACVYPKSVDVLIRTNDWAVGDAFIESDAMMRSPIRIFSRQGVPAISGTRNLKGLSLGYALGSRIPDSLGPIGAKYTPVADEVNKAKMLLLGTVDTIVANMPDAFFVFESLGSPLPAHDPNYDPVPVPRIRIVCHDTEANRNFIEAFNARLNMLTSGPEMANFMKKNRLDPSQFLP